MFMSYWGNITNIHEGPDFYRHGYGAEGSKAGAHGEPRFMRPGGWYRMVLRVFPPRGDDDNHTYVGWWVKDVGRNQWHTHSVVRIDTKATGVSGNSGFVEALAPDSVHRAFEYRLGYCRLDGKWHKANEVETTGPQFFKLIEDETVLRYERSEPDSPGGEMTKFVLKQPDAPPLDRPAIGKASALAIGNQVSVRWAIPGNASPQLGYRIELFDTLSADGVPFATFEDVAPHVLAKRMDLDRSPKRVRLSVTDIFDQTTSVMIPVRQTDPAVATRSADLRPGLRYAYYEAAEGVAWDRLPDLAAMSPAKQGMPNLVVGTFADKEDPDTLYLCNRQGFFKSSDGGRTYKLLISNASLDLTPREPSPQN